MRIRQLIHEIRDGLRERVEVQKENGITFNKKYKKLYDYQLGNILGFRLWMCRFIEFYRF